MSLTYDLFGQTVTNGIQNRNSFYEINGLSYIHDFITRSEEQYLLEEIDNHLWLDDLKRRVQHYGYKYDYRQHRIDYSMKIDDLPDWLQNLALRLKFDAFFEETPDQVIVNEYLPGQGITGHIDCPPCFTSTIASLSLASSCVMNFTNEDTEETIPYLLSPGSLVVLKDDARYKWKHGIKFVKSDNYFGAKIKRERRVSLTFRKVILETKF
jgi:alkylated DNA repair dioxygenase AlkB